MIFFKFKNEYHDISKYLIKTWKYETTTFSCLSQLLPFLKSNEQKFNLGSSSVFTLNYKLSSGWKWIAQILHHASQICIIEIQYHVTKFRSWIRVLVQIGNKIKRSLFNHIRSQGLKSCEAFSHYMLIITTQFLWSLRQF